MSSYPSAPTTWPSDSAYENAKYCCMLNDAITASVDHSAQRVFIFRPKTRGNETTEDETQGGETQGDEIVEEPEVESVDYNDYEDKKTDLGVATEFHQNSPPSNLERIPIRDV